MKAIKHIILAFLATFIYASECCAQSFNDYFTDQTLRIDYIFSGDVSSQSIAIDELLRSDGWYGKRQNLADVPMEGNGQIIVREPKEGKVIYRNSFSTLFQEWLTYDEAKTKKRAFENVFIIPMPRNEVEVEVVLYNNRREVACSMKHRVAPDDILIRSIGKEKQPYETVVEAKDFDRSIKIAFVAEGYKESEMGTFMEDVNIATEALFAHEPFASMKERFNVVAVKSASADSGTSEPKRGEWKNTVLKSNFDTFYSDRYLTTLHLKALHDVLAGIPYEHIIVLVNTSEYGGGGILNSYNLSMTHNKWFCPVVVHEFGHSFAGLADEYAYDEEPLELYPADVEPWEQNITTMVDFESKWKDMVASKTPMPTPEGYRTKKDSNPVGAFEGAGYRTKGAFRPCLDCRMRTNQTKDFCPVCQRAIQRVIDFYTK